MSTLEVVFPISSVNGTVRCVEIEIVDDEALEGEHNFTVVITSTNPPISTAEPSEAAVIILDNDGIAHLTLALLCFNCCPYELSL